MLQREEEFSALIQEISCKNTQEAKVSKLASSSTSATSWSRLKDPRIVRVSRVFGGKDRHSKVCTAKGLRDRRVRLSVPTAIQLYDLQERLGLNQPSKVVDWLLNATKSEIDELPPLQIPNGLSVSTQSLRPSFLEFGASQSEKLQSLRISGSANNSLKHQRSDPFWGKSMDVSCETSGRDENWSKNEDENQYVSPSICLASRQNPTSFSSSHNSISPHNPFFRLDLSNLTLSQPTQSHGMSTVRVNDEDLHNFSHLPTSSTLSFAPGSQVLVYQPAGTATQSHFSSQIAAMNTEFDPKQLNYQTLQLSTSSLSSPVNSSSAHSVRPFHFSMAANLISSKNNEQNNNSDQFHDSR